METQISRLHNQAIDEAIAGNWKQAIIINNEILAIDENNLDANLALGFAYLQEKKFDKSSQYYKKALLIEPGNIIARNNLDKLSILKKKGSVDTEKSDPTPLQPLKEFINITGKTKIVDLVNIGQSDVLADIKVGQQVELKSKKRRIEVRTLDGEYIGALPDDISKRLLFFLDAGTTYNAYVKSALKNQVEVFISEDRKSKKAKNFVSFPKNIQDDLKIMMQSMQNDDDDEEDEEDDEDDHEKTEFVDKQNHRDVTDEDDTEGITDLDALAADIDDESTDSFITNLSAYNEDGDDEEEE